MTNATLFVHVGTAGWGIPGAVADAFPGNGLQLERYARVLSCVEINTTFTRVHRRDTFERWASQTPPGFRFSVKVPKAFTHVARLHTPAEDVRTFVSSLTGLGERLAVLLVQLPPSLTLDVAVARAFFHALRAGFSGAIVCEPRHPSWFTSVAESFLVRECIARVAADPAKPCGAGQPGGWLGKGGDGQGALVYHRWHGSPRMYWSAYDDDWLTVRARELARWPAGTEVWCIFDNTTAGAAGGDALRLARRLTRPNA
jgi:uncharacterized protein YecE (DUF72 family)